MSGAIQIPHCDCDCDYIVEIEEVYSQFIKIKLNKSAGPDVISQKILKQMACYLAAPLARIINSSLCHGTVPDQWKITMVPKLFSPKNVESDLRPIAVTNATAKIAQKCVFILTIFTINI